MRVRLRHIALYAVVAVVAAVRAGHGAAAAAAKLDSSGPAAAAALEYAERSRGRFHSDLLELASKPSISSLPSHMDGIMAAAEWLRAKLEAIGLQDVQVLPTEGPHPVVYASLPAAPPAPGGTPAPGPGGPPTLLLYGHYDVQPVDPLSLWDSPPFEPRVEGGYFWGRGVDDDKGGLLNAVHAVESYVKGAGGLPVNVKLLIEGQEEIGSPNLAAFLRAHRGGLLAGVDLALSADGGQIAEDVPGILTGLRGAMAVDITVRTAATDVHSGTKGGSIQNAVHALVQLLASLRDPATNKVAVEGFYDSVVEPTPEDRRDMELFPFDAEGEAAAMGVEGFLGEEGRGTLERRWYRPTLEVVGLGGGFQGEGVKTIVPATAKAKVSARLVPNQTPDEIAAKLRAHVGRRKPPLANITIDVLTFRADPWTSPRDTPGNQAAARVLQRVMGRPPLFFKEGSTVPATAYFQRELGVPTTAFAFSLGNHIHAPNERLKASMFDKGTRAWVLLLEELARTGREPFADSKRAEGGDGGGGGAAARDEL